MTTTATTTDYDIFCSSTIVVAVVVPRKYEKNEEKTFNYFGSKTLRIITFYIANRKRWVSEVGETCPVDCGLR